MKLWIGDERNGLCELHIFWVDHKNHHKEGRGLYKMDEDNIKLLWEDLTEEFYSFVKTHSEDIRKLIDEFEDEQLQLAIELEEYK